MNPVTIGEGSLIICRKLFRGVYWSKIQTVCSYTPIAGLNEVDIRPLLKSISYKYPAIEIKILGQAKNQKIPKTKFDLILVPALAFDKDNYRLGWGGGFYDKFLAGQSGALKIGVCFQNGFIKNLPHETHDVALDKIVTEI